MNNLKDFSEEEIVKMIQEGKVKRKDFLDSGICPTCFDRRHNGILYGDDSARTIYQDEDMICMLVGDPKAVGHAIISTKKHFKDIMEVDDETLKKVYVKAKEVMGLIKEVYGAESVYECTMCDGEMNHFHLQMLPRYKEDERGSKNFTKDRQKYVEDLPKLKVLRERLNH